MYEYLYDPLPDRDAYFERIHMKTPVIPDKENLDAIIFLHQCYIPFENLDVYDLKRPLSLGIHDLFHKIVSSKRGGYCFELNGLFEKLLSECGYKVYSCSARITRGRDFVTPSLHRALLVEIDNVLHYCDVGFGGPVPAGALPLIDDLDQTIMGETFKLRKADPYWWVLNRYTNGTLEHILQFQLMPQDPVEFLAPNYYSYLNEMSYFNKTRVLNRRTENGSLSITDDIFTIIENGVRTESGITTKEELLKILRKYFDIILPL